MCDPFCCCDPECTEYSDLWTNNKLCISTTSAQMVISKCLKQTSANYLIKDPVTDKSIFADMENNKENNNNCVSLITTSESETKFNSLDNSYLDTLINKAKK